jgi:hypothetical protein
MKKFSLSILPALLLGAAMALSPAPASAVIYNYSGGGTYTDVTTSPATAGETFSASFVFDTTTGLVTSASMSTQSLGNYSSSPALGGVNGSLYHLGIANVSTTGPVEVLMAFDVNALLLGSPSR